MASSNNPLRWDILMNDTGYSDPVILENLVGIKSVQLSPVVAGTGKVQATISPLADVNGGTADWVDWSAGTVSSTTQDEVSGVSAVRAYRATGTIRFIVRVE